MSHKYQNIPQVEADEVMIQEFLKFIALDTADSIFTFQTVDDNKTEGAVPDSQLCRVFHGKFADLKEELLDLNNGGAGVFLSINQTDLKGRKKPNIVGIRAVYADVDEPRVQAFNLFPSATVFTDRGFHVYYRLHKGEQIELFEACQKTIQSSLNSDPCVIGLNSVMRLPGTVHRKDPSRPRLVTFVPGESTRRSIKEVLSAYAHPALGSIKIEKDSISRKPFENDNSETFPPLPLAKLNNVFRHCLAFGELKKKIQDGLVLSHYEGFALFHLCMAFNGGIDLFVEKVPGWGKTEADMAQLTHSIYRRYAPWTCAALQSVGICQFAKSDHCMEKKYFNGSLRPPSPIRFAYGAKPNRKIVDSILGKIGGQK